MSFLQFNFCIFFVILILAYYILPKKFQWICLLIGSYIFYIAAGVKTVGYIIFTTLTVWVGTIIISKISENMKSELTEKKKH